MEQVAIYITRHNKNFFVERAHINCPVSEFCACDGADKLFNVDAVLGRELVDIGEGILVSKPVKVERALRAGGDYVFASLSHNGILAIHSYREYYFVQFTNLNSDEQVELKVRSEILVGFYDDMAILLPFNDVIRETSVENVFKGYDLYNFKTIVRLSVFPFTDVSLLNETRVLYFPARTRKLYSFNVDTREFKEVEINDHVLCCASFAGINLGVKAVFNSHNDKTTYILSNNNSVSKLGGENIWIRSVFPSCSCPTDINSVALWFDRFFIFKGKKVMFNSSFKTRSHNTIVRIYRDIFLFYDDNTDGWALVRIIVP